MNSISHFHIASISMTIAMTLAPLATRADSIYYLAPEMDGKITVLKRMDTSTGLSDIVSASLPFETTGYLQNSAVYIDDDGTIFFSDGASVLSSPADGQEATLLFTSPTTVAFDDEGRLPALQKATSDKLVLKYSEYGAEFDPYSGIDELDEVYKCIYLVDLQEQTINATDFIAEPEDVNSATGLIRGVYNSFTTSTNTVGTLADWNLVTDQRTDIFSFNIKVSTVNRVAKISSIEQSNLLVLSIESATLSNPIPSGTKSYDTRIIPFPGTGAIVPDIDLKEVHPDTLFTGFDDIVYMDGTELVRLNLFSEEELNRVEVGEPMSYMVKGPLVTFFYPAEAVPANDGLIYDRVPTLTIGRDLSSPSESSIDILHGGEGIEYIRGDGPGFIDAGNILLSKDETTVFLIGKGGLMAVDVASGDRTIVSDIPVNFLSTPSLGTTQTLTKNSRPPSEVEYSAHLTNILPLPKGQHDPDRNDDKAIDSSDVVLREREEAVLP